MIRPAKISDITKVHELIGSFAERHVLLPVPLADLYRSVREFFVAESDGRIVGAAALRFYWDDLAEIRSLAVTKGEQGKGLGAELLAACEGLALEYELPRVFALSYKPEFFERYGYKRADKESLPQKVWRDCVNCHEFPSCSEIALIKDISK